MNSTSIFYADDDEDDFMFFNDAVEKITAEKKDDVKLHLHLHGDLLLENLEKIKNQKGLVFLDSNMPKRSGLKLLEDIRKEANSNEVPVIMYSTSYDQFSIAKSHNLGANLYVVKPYNFHDLIEMITKIMTIKWEKQVVNLENFVYKKDH